MVSESIVQNIGKCVKVLAKQILYSIQICYFERN